MSRRVHTYGAEMGWGGYNLLSTVGAYVMAVSVLLFIVNFLLSRRSGEVAGDDPWQGPTLEWATSSPPQPYNFLYLPVVRSRYPLWQPPDAPPGRDTAADRGLRALPQFRDDKRESWGTTIVTAEPESRVDLPFPSIWPLLAALAVSVAFVGMIWSLWSVPVGAFLFYLTMIGWHWPFDKELAT